MTDQTNYQKYFYIAIGTSIGFISGYYLYNYIYEKVAHQIKNKIKNTFKESSEFINPHKVEFFEKNKFYFVMGNRSSYFLKDYSGTFTMINCHCNGGLFNFGHRNPEIIHELKKALKYYDIGNHHLMSIPRANLARELKKVMPGDIQYTIFGVSGGEAVDVALKLAIGYTKRNKIIAAKGGYHGHTGLAVVCGDEQYLSPFGMDNQSSSIKVTKINFNDIEELKKHMDDKTAAIILETIPATLGMPIPNKEYFKQVRELCDKFGVQMIIDEVQTGFGRTGKFLGIEHYNVVPDIIILGKAMSGGIYPITATCIRKHLMSVFKDNPFAHVSTFGGSELGCQVALKVLEMSTNPKNLNHVNHLAEYFKKEMQILIQKFPKYFIEFRQLGLFCGIKTLNESFGPHLSNHCLKNGLLIIFANNDKSVLQFLPPLNLKMKDAKEIMRRLEIAFKEAIESFH